MNGHSLMAPHEIVQIIAAATRSTTMRAAEFAFRLACSVGYRKPAAKCRLLPLPHVPPHPLRVSISMVRLYAGRIQAAAECSGPDVGLNKFGDHVEASVADLEGALSSSNSLITDGMTQISGSAAGYSICSVYEDPAKAPCVVKS
jgi:hypothetical protein